MYLDEHEDAAATRTLVEAEGRRCVTLAADVRDPKACSDAVERCVRELGKLDILVNNAAVQHYRASITDMRDEDIASTFETNILGMFYMAMAAVKHLPSGGTIINTTSVTAYAGEAHLLDYSATKGAIVSFTRGLSQQLAGKGIRVNAVAPGPIWTPLIPATFPRAAILTWQKQVPMQRAGQPSEVGPCYVFLASDDGSYFSGQVLHPNGGTPVNS
ncbi:putative oxidoreductase YhxC [Tetrabaena socialis]|uniref:Putative oxidoreductase YhxC n=1 Tax=Tetrabaena socialis TaxID=47790 RepID=A0A2J8AB42_9CHLO|nr:putative oxidoreductase YhxC [Tetrabaena socialis]|eukprot:PNH09731.1 putative oxidoreductase YhxC [Tetrabaena socialis]